MQYLIQDKLLGEQNKFVDPCTAETLRKPVAMARANLYGSQNGSRKGSRRQGYSMAGVEASQVTLYCVQVHCSPCVCTVGTTSTVVCTEAY